MFLRNLSNLSVFQLEVFSIEWNSIKKRMKNSQLPACKKKFALQYFSRLLNIFVASAYLSSFILSNLRVPFNFQQFCSPRVFVIISYPICFLLRSNSFFSLPLFLLSKWTTPLRFKFNPDVFQSQYWTRLWTGLSSYVMIRLGIQVDVRFFEKNLCAQAPASSTT